MWGYGLAVKNVCKPFCNKVRKRRDSTGALIAICVPLVAAAATQLELQMSKKDKSSKLIYGREMPTDFFVCDIKNKTDKLFNFMNK